MTSRRNERGERTRQKLLEAGLELFSELTPAQLFEGLSAKLVCRRVGMTTGAFYNHFPDHAAYVDALIEYGLSRHAREDQILHETFEQIIAYANAPGTHLVDDMIELVAENFRKCVTVSDLYGFIFTVWTRRADPRVSELLRGRYAWFMDEYVVGEDMIRERWNVEWRAPFDMQNAAELISAALEGAVIRHVVRPELISPELYAQSVLAFIAGATVPEGVRADGETFLDALHRHGIRDWEPPAGHPTTPRISDAIVDATLELLREADMDDCTVDRIAERAGTTREHVYSTWGSRSRLSTAVVGRLTDRFGPQVALDLEIPIPGIRALDRQIGRLATLFVELGRTRRTLLSLALRGSVEHMSRSSPEDGNLGAVLVPAIERAQEEGSIAAGLEAALFARSLSFTIATRALEAPDTSPDALLTIARSFVGGVATPGGRPAPRRASAR